MCRHLVFVLFVFVGMLAGCFALRRHSDSFVLGFSDPEETFSKSIHFAPRFPSPSSFVI